MGNLDVNICGFVGAKPQLQVAKDNENAKAWVRFSVATNPNYRNSRGEWVQGETIWFTCKAWGELAQHIAHSVSKGERVLIQGRLAPTTWESVDPQTQQNIRHRDMAIHIQHIGIDLARHQTQTVTYRDTPETQEADYGQAAQTETSPATASERNSSFGPPPQGYTGNQGTSSAPAQGAQNADVPAGADLSLQENEDKEMEGVPF